MDSETIYFSVNDLGSVSANMNFCMLDHTLIITGYGVMPDYGYGSNRPWSSYSNSATRISVFSGITTVGSYAFCDFTGLRSVSFPDSLTALHEGVFTGCESLTSVVIPDSVTTIPTSAFSYCSALKEVTLPGSLTSIEDCAFSNCYSLETIEIPYGTTSIGEEAFDWCTSLKEITVPASVISIGQNAITDSLSTNKITIIGEEGSTAANYARANGITFVSITQNGWLKGDDGKWYY